MTLTLEEPARDAYRLLTAHAPWWPDADTDAAGPHVRYIADMTAGYVECILWSSCDPATEEPLDAVDAVVDDVELGACAALCASFYVHNARDLLGFAPWADDAGQAGHDLALTRNGHGTGYWVRVHPDGPGIPRYHAAERLSAAAREHGEVYPYLWVREDGRRYVVELAGRRFIGTDAERDLLRAAWPDIEPNRP